MKKFCAGETFVATAEATQSLSRVSLIQVIDAQSPSSSNSLLTLPKLFVLCTLCTCSQHSLFYSRYSNIKTSNTEYIWKYLHCERIAKIKVVSKRLRNPSYEGLRQSFVSLLKSSNSKAIKSGAFKPFLCQHHQVGGCSLPRILLHPPSPWPKSSGPLWRRLEASVTGLWTSRLQDCVCSTSKIWGRPPTL